MKKIIEVTIPDPMDANEEMESLQRKNGKEQLDEMHELLEAIDELAQRGFGTHLSCQKSLFAGMYHRGKAPY